MSKGHQRSNREAKKPKQQKAKPIITATSFGVMQPKPTAGSSAGKKK
ncbi:MAG: hypothetical protein HYX36_15975 [Rhizobiales bacterium]|nr:hypothetical protein [Hyphomicrobiales bacterium]